MRRTLTIPLLLACALLWVGGLLILSGPVPAERFKLCLIPAALAFATGLWMLFSGRVLSRGDVARRHFTTMTALTMLVSLGCVWADVLVLGGRIFASALEWLNVALFLDSRTILTLALGSGVVHPALFILGSITLASLEDGRG